MLEDRVVALFAARYCREPQAFDRRVETRQAVGFTVNEALIALFEGFVAQLHDEELGQIGEVHLQEVVLLEILKLGANGKEFDHAASLVALDLVRNNGLQVDSAERTSSGRKARIFHEVDSKSRHPGGAALSL
jgi:hypothetical protein